MERRVLLGTALAAAVGFILYSGHQLSEGAVAEGKKPAGEAASPAAQQKPAVGDEAEDAHFMWRLFIQAMTPAKGGLNVEGWSEQCDLNPAMIGCLSPGAGAQPQANAPGKVPGKVRHGHGSALARALSRKLVGAAAQNPASQVGCNSMNNLSSTPSFQPFVPNNLSSNPVFCEEVFVDKTEADFVKSNELTTLRGQEKYGMAHAGAVTFPSAAVEIKLDWIPQSSLTAPSFNCSDPANNSLYTEVIQFQGEPKSECYALVGIHISSKKLPDWLWATFEPNSNVTNPNRCNGNLYSTCFDPWGTTSDKPYDHEHPATQSKALHSAMAAAKLNQSFNNYFLTGVQTQFVSGGNPVLLGNSFVEFNAQVLPQQASCITCHRYAYFDGNKPAANSPENNFGGPQSWPSTGYACTNVPATGNCLPRSLTSQDFSWMLGLMPYAHGH